MQKLLVLWLLFTAAGVFGVDYGDAANWAICDGKEAAPEQEFDVFYVYPTLFADDKQTLMDWSQEKLAKKTVGYSQSQAGLWGKKARVFVPYVRQLECTRCLALLETKDVWEKTLLRPGIDDAKDAFSFYMKHYNQGRPFILFGHSQGAMELYCVLKDDTSISVKNGLVAAYLIGLPGITEKQLSRDFSGREIAFAKGADDLGAIIGWNTQTEAAENSLFAGTEIPCINPLNWRRDETRCSPKENLGAVIYNYKSGAYTREKEFCGAYIDKEKGALIAVLPQDSPYLKENNLGKGILHSYDIYFFAENLKANALERVKQWKSRFHNIEKNVADEKGETMNLVNGIELPDWLKKIEMANVGKPMPGDAAKIQFAINLALENVRQKTGGPFGAAIFDMESDCLVAVGVNCVVPAKQSWAHAEMIAFARGQNKLQTYDLKNCLLATSCEPCAMCFGATPWSGVKALLYGAPGDMARAVNFDEGDKIPDWEKSLEKRGISVRGPLCLEEAAKPFDLYKENGGVIY